MFPHASLQRPDWLDAPLNIPTYRIYDRQRQQSLSTILRDTPRLRHARIATDGGVVPAVNSEVDGVVVVQHDGVLMLNAPPCWPWRAPRSPKPCPPDP